MADQAIIQEGPAVSVFEQAERQLRSQQAMHEDIANGHYDGHKFVDPNGDLVKTIPTWPEEPLDGGQLAQGQLSGSVRFAGWAEYAGVMDPEEAQQEAGKWQRLTEVVRNAQAEAVN